MPLNIHKAQWSGENRIPFALFHDVQLNNPYFGSTQQTGHPK